MTRHRANAIKYAIYYWLECRASAAAQHYTKPEFLEMTDAGVCSPWRPKDGDAGMPVNLVCRCMFGPLGGERTLADAAPLPELSCSTSEKGSAPLLLAMRAWSMARAFEMSFWGSMASG